MRLSTVLIFTPILALVGWFASDKVMSFETWLWIVFIPMFLLYLASFIKPKKEILYVQGPGRYEQEVVGESQYQKALKAISGGYAESGAAHRKQVHALLILEDDNPHDPKAVRVEINGCDVGYLNRDDARKYRRRLKSVGKPRLTIKCDAVIVGGWNRGIFDKGYFGVYLDLPVDDL